MKVIGKLIALVTLALAMSVPAFAGTLNPDTGDNSIVTIMLVVGGVALLLIVAFLLTGKKKDK